MGVSQGHWGRSWCLGEGEAALRWGWCCLDKCAGGKSPRFSLSAADSGLVQDLCCGRSCVQSPEGTAVCTAGFPSQEGMGSRGCQRGAQGGPVLHPCGGHIAVPGKQHWVHGSSHGACCVLMESLAAALAGPFPDGEPHPAAPSMQSQRSTQQGLR